MPLVRIKLPRRELTAYVTPTWWYIDGPRQDERRAAAWLAVQVKARELSLDLYEMAQREEAFVVRYSVEDADLVKAPAIEDALRIAAQGAVRLPPTDQPDPVTP